MSGRPANGGRDLQRGVLAGLGVGALALVLGSFLGVAPESPAERAPATPSPVDQWAAARTQAAVPAEEEQPGVPLEPVAKEKSGTAAPERPAAVAFSFLGKLMEHGQEVVLLHGGGRMLKVRGPGPIDSDYVVDAYQRGYVILRHVRLGTSQLVEFTAARNEIDPAWRPEDSARD